MARQCLDDVRVIQSDYEDIRLIDDRSNLAAE
jgi:hypothetical protein